MDDQTVFLVDDDAQVREVVGELLNSAGLKTRSFGSAGEFLERYDSTPGCLLLDVRMPEMDGMALLDKLVEQAINLPVIIFTGYGDLPIAIQALRSGAVDFIEKPCGRDVLVDRVKEALKGGKRLDPYVQVDPETLALMATLTPRERQVLRLLLAGKTNKGVADELGISAKTVEKHRARVMQKMGVDNMASLARKVFTAQSPA